MDRCGCAVVCRAKSCAHELGAVTLKARPESCLGGANAEHVLAFPTGPNLDFLLTHRFKHRYNVVNSQMKWSTDHGSGIK